MALGAPSPVEHPGRNLQEAVCLRTVQSAAEKHAIGLLDDRVNPHLVRKPGMMRVQNFTPDGLMGVLKPCCTMPIGHTRPSMAGRPTRFMLCRKKRRSWRRNQARNPPWPCRQTAPETGTTSLADGSGKRVNSILEPSARRLECIRLTSAPNAHGRRRRAARKGLELAVGPAGSGGAADIRSSLVGSRS